MSAAEHLLVLVLMARQFLHQQLFLVLMVGQPLHLQRVLVLMARQSLLLQQSLVVGRRPPMVVSRQRSRLVVWLLSFQLSPIAVATLLGSGKSVQGPASSI